MSKYVRVFSFSLSSLGSDVVGAVSANMGSPFTIKNITFVSTEQVSDTRRLRAFVAPDSAPANVAAPNGTNILAAAGGTGYFLPDAEQISININYVVPDYDRRVKIQFDNTSAVPTTVSGSVTVESE